MSMRMQVNVDASNFLFAMREMQRQMGAVEFDRILRNEVRAIIRRAAQLTKQASKGRIRRSVLDLDKKRTHIKLPNGKLVNPNWRLSASDWNLLESYRRDKLKEAQARIGLSRQAWIQIATDLGLPVDEAGLGNASSARVDGRRIRHRGTTGTRTQTGRDSVVYLLKYGNPVGVHAGARKALIRAINGRVGFFRNNLRAGVFRDAAQIAAKYPGLTISRT